MADAREQDLLLTHIAALQASREEGARHVQAMWKELDHFDDDVNTIADLGLAWANTVLEGK